MIKPSRRWKVAHPMFKEADLQLNGDGNPELRSRCEKGGLEHEKTSSGRRLEKSATNGANGRKRTYSQTETRI